MFARSAAATLHALARGFPVVAITGPRQSGKTTLARAAFPELPYINLEDPDTHELALSDPRRFINRHQGGAVLHEVQRAPRLMSYLLGIANGTTSMGRWVLTGSQEFGLMGNPEAPPPPGACRASCTSGATIMAWRSIWCSSMPGDCTAWRSSPASPMAATG